MGSALEVFAKIGPDKASLKDVADEAGVSHGLVTHYFGRFELLVEQVLEEAARKSRQHIVERLMTMEDQSLEAALDVFFEAMSDPQHGRLVAWALLSGRAAKNDFFTKSSQGPRRVADVIEARLRQQYPQADIRRDEIDRLIALVLVAGFSMSFGRGAIWEALGRQDDEDERLQFRAWLAEVVRGRVRNSMSVG